VALSTSAPVTGVKLRPQAKVLLRPALVVLLRRLPPRLLLWLLLWLLPLLPPQMPHRPLLRLVPRLVMPLLLPFLLLRLLLLLSTSTVMRASRSTALTGSWPAKKTNPLTESRRNYLPWWSHSMLLAQLVLPAHSRLLMLLARAKPLVLGVV
jgi:hypothetical protein